MDMFLSLVLLGFTIYGAVHASKRLTSFLRVLIASRVSLRPKAVSQPSTTKADGS